MRFTHERLAKMGGCSRSTITYALKGTGSLSKDTRERLGSLCKIPELLEVYFKDPMFEKVMDLAFDKLPRRTKGYTGIRAWIANIKALHIYLRDGGGERLSDFDRIFRENDPYSVISNKDFFTVCSVAYTHTSNHKLALFITDLIRFVKLIEKE